MAFCGYHPSGPECLISRPIAEDGGALPGAAPRSVAFMLDTTIRPQSET